jgi:hypothetical protein
MQWSITTSPTGTACTWEQLKAHVRPGNCSEQPYLLDLLASATTYAETKLEACLLPQTITAIFDIEDIGWAGEYQFAYLTMLEGRNRWQLPRGPILSITSVTDTNGNPVRYLRHTEGNADFIIPQIPIARTMAPVTVVYQAGYEIIPADILNAIKVHVATIYFNREDTSNLATNPVHRIDDFYSFRGRGSCVA